MDKLRELLDEALAENDILVDNSVLDRIPGDNEAYTYTFTVTHGDTTTNQ